MLIDTHVHLVPQDFPERPGGVPANQWPVMEPLADGSARLLFAGKEFRRFGRAAWDIDQRIAQMDRDGVTIQILSPLPELHCYWFDTRAAAAIGEHINRTIAQAAARAPLRLAGLGMVPLQDVALSIEAARAIQQLGLRGVLVASNINGVSLADERFEPFFAEIEALELVLFVHGYRPAGTERLVGAPQLAALIGVPLETAAVIASLITTDILGRFPRLKLAFAHGGGAIGAMIDRFDHGWQVFGMSSVGSIAPRDYLRRFHYDTVVYGADYLRYLVALVGPDRIIAGTDGPPPIGQRELGDFVRSACGDDPEIADKLLWRNAARLFGLEPIV